MIMKKELMVLLCLFCGGEAWSQSVESVKDTVVQQSTDKYKVETNRFFDNWFIGAGAGAQIFFSDHDKQLKFGDRLTPGFEFYLGKSFSPGIAVRLAANGYKLKGLTQNGAHSTGEVFDASKRLSKQEFKYYNLHGDVLFNLTNIISGYREDRVYSLSPYIGLGWMHTWDKPVESGISANIGILNSFRISDGLDITVDFRGSLVDDKFDGEVGGRKWDGLLTGALGLKYTFKKRNWDRSSTTVIRYSDKELNALRDQLNTLANDNEILRKQLAQAGNKSVTDVVVEKNIIVAPVLLTFPINKSVVSNEMRVNLGFLAKVIKEGRAQVKYRVTGYADKGTGSKKTNERLSKERAQAIYNVLVKEFDVPPSQIEVSHEGGVDNMFYDDPRLSRAVITIAN